jgi:hypothetical protein
MNCICRQLLFVGVFVKVVSSGVSSSFVIPLVEYGVGGKRLKAEWLSSVRKRVMFGKGICRYCL